MPPKKDYRALARARFAKKSSTGGYGRAGRAHKAKYMTKKGAYKKSTKQNTRNVLRPFLESKTVTGEEVASDMGVTEMAPVIDNITNPMTAVTLGRDTASNHFWCWSILSMRQGIFERTMIGKSIYAQYLKQKFQIALPSGPYMIKHPAQVYLIHGWCKAPLNKTAYTSPTMDGLNRGDLIEHIEDQVKQYYDERKDKLRFRPKATANLKILGFQKVRARKDDNLGVASNTVALNESTTEPRGAHAEISMSCTWTIKRKLHYTPGVTNVLQFLYTNHSWLPFTIIYNPSFAEYTDASSGSQNALYRIQVKSNNQLWFLDA